MIEPGLDMAALDLAKYDPEQPRVPAGSGRASGRWTSGSDADALVAPIAAARSFLATASPEALASLATFAARFATPTAVLGALFIPTPNSGGVTQGTLPDAPDIRFQQDGPAGTLRLATTASNGSEVIVAAQNRRGIYVDLTTGQAIGRDLGGQLYLDLDAVHDAIQDALPVAEGEPERRPQAADDEPKLCPAPTPDVAHGASEEALSYEDDVHARVNPIAPLPPKFGVSLLDPNTGDLVYFDDCFRDAGDLVDGDMAAGDLVEAKGSRYAYLLSQSFGETIMNDFVDQAWREKGAAEARGVRVKWYFAEEAAADLVRKRFAREGLGDIVVAYMPPRRRR